MCSILLPMTLTPSYFSYEAEHFFILVRRLIFMSTVVCPSYYIPEESHVLKNINKYDMLAHESIKAYVTCNLAVVSKLKGDIK